MKKLLLLTLVILLSFGCDDDDNGDDNGIEYDSFVTTNMKEDSTQFVHFATNTASTTEPVEFDMYFKLVTRIQSTESAFGPCTYMPVPEPHAFSPVTIRIPEVAEEEKSSVTVDPLFEIVTPVPVYVQS